VCIFEQPPPVAGRKLEPSELSMVIETYSQGWHKLACPACGVVAPQPHNATILDVDLLGIGMRCGECRHEWQVRHVVEKRALVVKQLDRRTD
jgi:hypothetical protein